MIRKIWEQLHYALLAILPSVRIHGVLRLLTVLIKVWLIGLLGSWQVLALTSWFEPRVLRRHR